ncbi:hypothetical protein QE152_g1755 [Popillia japonica]|uniref:Uncharacterized protein n=1 Tax=Popillia japonica TaxID=7064 RepID=A0AAW1N588_POPJA
MVNSVKKIRTGDPDFEEVAMRWFEEVGDNSSDIDDCQSDDCEASEHDSDSNLSADERNDTLDSENSGEQMNESFINTERESEDQAENTNVTKSKKNYFCKNRFKWSSVAFQGRSRTRRHNIVLQLPGLRPSANLGYEASPKAVWKLIFSDEILNIILQWTNVKISTTREKRPKEQDGTGAASSYSIGSLPATLEEHIFLTTYAEEDTVTIRLITTETNCQIDKTDGKTKAEFDCARMSCHVCKKDKVVEDNCVCCNEVDIVEYRLKE